MVNQITGDLDSVFSALADPTRRSILERLSHGDATVSELAEPFDISLPAISKHLTVLEHAGLLVRQREGRMRICHLSVGPMQGAADWLSHYRAFWEDQLDALEEYLNDSSQGEEK